MNVLDVAASIGLASPDGGELFGTIEEELVLSALVELANAHPQHEDLFAEAAVRVQLSRSAGVQQIEPGSVFAAYHPAQDVQLRYRSEMLDVFVDLAIDLGVRGQDPVGQDPVGQDPVGQDSVGV